MKLSVLLRTLFWTMVNLDYRKCSQLYEKINPVTHSVGSTATEMTVCELLGAKVPFLKLNLFFFLKIHPDFHPLIYTGFPFSSGETGPQNGFTVLKKKMSLHSLAVFERTVR